MVRFSHPSRSSVITRSRPTRALQSQFDRSASSSMVLSALLRGGAGRAATADFLGFIDFGIVGRISPRTWAAMEVFLASFATEDYDAMASALSEMGATGNDINTNEFAKDLRKIFSSIQDLDTEIIVATARTPDATAVSANVVLDERQMNALFLDLVRVSESYGLKFPREFALLMKQLLYFDRYTRLLAPSMNMLRDERINISTNRQPRTDRFQ